MTQTRENTESLALQYELRRHAAELGWAEQQITVIDEDLARSAASTSGRLGFTDLVAAVGLGKVGIIVGREVSRLARNNSDWYQVLDLCSITDTLIADADGIYHPGSFNDRLVLGLKGQMAEAELHMLRMRLTAALRHKAARGELRQLLPVGLDYDDDGKVVLSGDEAVRSAISQVYALFTQLGSARQVMTTLRERGLLLPRRKAGSRRITWAEASYPAVHDLLTNPAYAGAYVFGRTRTEKRLDTSGKVVSRDRTLPREEWQVLITGHHPGYLDWDTWQDTQARLRANFKPPRGDGGGAARKGAALLSGLIRCGLCGRMMQVGYSGHGGDAPRYVCGRGTQLYGTPPCQSIGGAFLHHAVLGQLFQVLEPASLEATARAMADAGQRHRDQVTAFELALERARFEADRAMRKHEEVEPGNRLVARTLEARLEERLAAVQRAEAALAAARARHPVHLTGEELAWLTRAGADIRAIFDAPATTNIQRKRWLRDGFLTGEQLTPGAPWQIRITPALRGKIRPGVPDGWLPLDQAAAVLGIARQTVLHKVQRGELNAAHVTSGRRKSLRIQVEHDQPGLFNTPHETKGAVLTMTDFTGQDADAAGGDQPAQACDGFLVRGGGEQRGGGDGGGERHAGEAVVGLQVRDHGGSFPAPGAAPAGARHPGPGVSRWRR